jgi:serine/threonine protein kinase
VTSHGDIYSYGSVMLQARTINATKFTFLLTLYSLQVLTGKLPYSHLAKDAEVLLTLHYSVHPPRPQKLADEHWALISRCWAKNPRTRPDIKYVYESVQCHYRAQSATADYQAVSDTIDAVVDNGVVVRGTPFLTLAFIWAFIMECLFNR